MGYHMGLRHLLRAFGSGLLVFVWLGAIVNAQQVVNVTTNRGDQAIVYEPDLPGTWREAWPGVRISDDSQAKATFEFTGVAVYYQGWHWSQPTTFTAKVDDGPDITLDLIDSRSATSADPNATITPTTPVTILLAEGLKEAKHTVVLTKTSDQREVIVGGFIYTTSHPPTSDTSKSAGPTATNQASLSAGHVNLKVLLPAVLGSVSALFLIAGW